MRASFTATSLRRSLIGASVGATYRRNAGASSAATRRFNDADLHPAPVKDSPAESSAGSRREFLSEPAAIK